MSGFKRNRAFRILVRDVYEIYDFMTFALYDHRLYRFDGYDHYSRKVAYHLLSVLTFRGENIWPHSRIVV